jgi:hypothetical protein
MIISDTSVFLLLKPMVTVAASGYLGQLTDFGIRGVVGVS